MVVDIFLRPWPHNYSAVMALISKVIKFNNNSLNVLIWLIFVDKTNSMCPVYDSIWNVNIGFSKAFSSKNYNIFHLFFVWFYNSFNWKILMSRILLPLVTIQINITEADLDRTAATSKVELFLILINGWKPLTIKFDLGCCSSPRSASDILL